MGKVSRSLLLQYNKCAALATRYSNLLDSFWHKDDAIPAESIADLDTYLAEKVDKETGKGLSTNDYTTAEKEKLTNLKSFKTITDGTNSFEAVNAADLLTFEGVVVDPANRKIKIASELSITDKDNIEKFKVTDKLSFGETFEFDPILKKITIRNTPWQTIQTEDGVDGTVRCKIVGNRLLVESDSIYIRAIDFGTDKVICRLPYGFSVSGVRLAYIFYGSDQDRQTLYINGDQVTLTDVKLDTWYAFYNDFVFKHI